MGFRTEVIRCQMMARPAMKATKLFPTIYVPSRRRQCVLYDVGRERYTNPRNQWSDGPHSGCSGTYGYHLSECTHSCANASANAITYAAHTRIIAVSCTSESLEIHSGNTKATISRNHVGSIHSTETIPPTYGQRSSAVRR